MAGNPRQAYQPWKGYLTGYMLMKQNHLKIIWFWLVFVLIFEKQTIKENKNIKSA